MKKLFLFAILFVFCFAINAQSQSTRSPEEVRFGLKVGANFATLTGDTENVKSRTSLHFGGVVEIPISENFSVQPEILYSSQGAKDSNSDDELKLDYLNIPVLAKFYVAHGLSIEAGPQIGFLLSAKEEFDGESEDIKDFIKGTDFGLSLGIGCRMATGLNFGARYNIGLSDIPEGDGDGNIKNGVFQVFIGLLF